MLCLIFRNLEYIIILMEQFPNSFRSLFIKIHVKKKKLTGSYFIKADLGTTVEIKVLKISELCNKKYLQIFIMDTHEKKNTLYHILPFNYVTHDKLNSVELNLVQKI